MTKKLILTLLLMTSVFLVACGNEKKEETYDKDLIFLEKSDDTDWGYDLIFESKKDKAYYSVEVDNYTYDNVEFKEKEEIKVDGKKETRGGIFEENSSESIFIFDEWRPLYKLKLYTKKND